MFIRDLAHYRQIVFFLQSIQYYQQYLEVGSTQQLPPLSAFMVLSTCNGTTAFFAGLKAELSPKHLKEVAMVFHLKKYPKLKASRIFVIHIFSLLCAERLIFESLFWFNFNPALLFAVMVIQVGKSMAKLGSFLSLQINFLRRLSITILVNCSFYLFFRNTFFSGLIST